MTRRNILKKQYKYLHKIYTILVLYQLNYDIQIKLICFCILLLLLFYYLKYRWLHRICIIKNILLRKTYFVYYFPVP